MTEREAIAKWMIANSLATGHGDTVDDLLSEAAGQIAELRARVAQLEVVHRELAQICWEGGSLDGGELQDLLVKHGVLVEATVEKPLLYM